MGTIRVVEESRWDWVHMELGKANAVGPEFLDEMSGVLDQIGTYEPEAPARPVLFTGEGSVFSAGLDLPTLVAMDREGMIAFLRRFDRVFRRLATLPRPSLAVIQGHAVAGGAVAALACDFRIAAKTTRSGKPFVIGLRESAIGLPLPGVVAQIVEHALPPGGPRSEIVLTGTLYSPEEARARGMVDLVVPHAELAGAAEAAAERFTQSTGRAVAALKKRFAMELHSGHGRESEDREFLEIWFGPEAQRRLREVVVSLGR